MRARLQITLFLSVLFLAVTVGSSPTHAGVSKHVKKRARKLFKEGVRAFKAANYPVALTSFIASHKLRPKAIVVYNIAMCHRALFRYKRSIAAFRQYLKMRGPRVSKKKKRRIAKMIPEMEAKLARVTLNVSPAGTRVTLDGDPVGAAPLSGPIALDPGRRVLKLSSPGYRPVRRVLSVTDGQRIQLKISLTKILQTGFLHISARARGALAGVDGGKPQALPRSFKLVEGEHRIHVTAPGHKPKTIVVTVQGGRLVTREVLMVPLPRIDRRVERRPPPRRPDLRLTPPRRGPPQKPKSRSVVRPFYQRAWFWTLVGAVVVGAGASAGVLIWKDSQLSRDYDESVRLR